MNEKRIRAPVTAFEEEIAKSIKPWVIPQGIRTVIIPKRIGVKNDFALV
jgi:hypothetical protein